MRYFSRGPVLYGLVYSIWRGSRAVAVFLASRFYASVLNCGANTKFGIGAFVSHPRNVSIGLGCSIGNNVAMVSEGDDGRLKIGDGVRISDRARLDFSGTLTVGAGVTISEGALVYTHGHGYVPRSVPQTYALVVGDNAWIGVEAVVMPGVASIGAGAIVGARSVVTGDVADNAVVAGVPAKRIGTVPRG